MRQNTSALRRRVVGLAAATAAAASVGIVALAPPASAAVSKIEGTAANAASLTPIVNAYRALLGDPNNGSALGSQPAGRREINWDGTPDAQSSPNQLPRDFFNTTVPRGVVFSNANNRFQVSADSANPTTTPVRFGNFNAQYPNIFGTFSPERLFAPTHSTVTRIHFFEPGTNWPATVNGFGAVFTDVDRTDSTKIELYDQWGGLIWWQNVIRGQQASKSLSFLGVTTDAEIYEVRITSGNTPLSAGNNDGGSWDVVVMDDFLYAEPQRL
ncbi:hypothetical protein WEI85_41985 [Actinomycetes bacterium KLBMP 9797]